MKKLIYLLLCFSTVTVLAQNNKKPATAPPALPKVTITIGGFKGGDITSDILSRIIDSSLVARDEKGNKYAIVRFRSIYKFKSSYEDPETGVRKTTDDMRINDFNDTSIMTELWRQSIKDNIVKGDQMILDNMIVQLKNGNKIMAPAITFKVIR
ncbi:hypothetical protein [Agriterribacter sp.]|uniref:hypothetical protein n=1 Tax=Agriterribacter sp. TaxID=2821509 RepID=UPI002CB687A4|nr:hypothetical protein [Agriterribacter sp.]HRO45243.1 hypothetical protein [Agriterribacter sp.]HRQ16846.1 hypothetical protein [Agriterribacter sp.]